jgi:site-specific DNA recombinase
MEESQPSPVRIAAIYARVSTDNQRTQGTIQSQLDELRELAGARGLAVGPELVFCDAGISGATLVRPALERLRDGAAEGSFEVVLCHSPDRLARRYAYQVASRSCSRWRASVPRRPRASCYVGCRG